MCDGVTQGRPGMELSLFSRDTIAMGTAIALSHDVFDAALLLGICDKIVPGLLIGALHFGHLPCVFVPGGPMASGLANAEKSKVREQYALGPVGRDELLEAESGVVPRPRHLHLLRHRQQQPDAARGDGPARAGRGLRPSARRLREALTSEAVGCRARVLAAARRAAARFLPIGRLVDERSIVNAMVALLATGGSTNHLIHWVAVRALGRHRRSTGATSPSCRARRRCWRASIRTAAPT